MMRYVTLIESPGEITYPFVAVDRQTGDTLLRLADRAALLALCHRLGWTVHQDWQCAGELRRQHEQRPARFGMANWRLGGQSAYRMARRRRERTQGMVRALRGR